MNSQWRPLARSAQAIALEVLVNGPLSRSELARRVNLSQSSLTRLANPMVESGLLVETPAARTESRIGRPTRPLDIVPASQHFVGIKVAGDTATGVVTTLRAEIVATRTVSISEHDPPAVVAVIARLVHELTRGVYPVAGLGISLGGRADDGSVVTGSSLLGWTDKVPLGSLVGAALGLPVVVENDVTALMEAERWFGAGRVDKTFALLTIGAGIGYELVIDGALVTTYDATIPRIGHEIVSDVGPRCVAGHRGCVTAMLTTGGIQDAISAGLRRRIDYGEAVELVRSGDRVATARFEDAGRALGRLVATIANFSTARTIVLSGEGIALAHLVRPVVDESLADSRDPQAAPLSLLVRPGDFTEWARGAAVVAIQAFVSARTDRPARPII